MNEEGFNPKDFLFDGLMATHVVIVIQDAYNYVDL